MAAALGRAPAAEVLAAMRGEASPGGGSAPGGGPLWPECPYLGLMPFGEQEARLFYGRSELVEQLVWQLSQRLDGTGILLVAGESGSGKSSLLRAGLMPRLAAGALGPGSEMWPRRVIRPAASPLRELAICLGDVAGSDPVSVYRAFLGAAHHAARRGIRRRRSVIAGLVALTMIAVSAAGIAVRDAANASRQAANASRQHAIALSRQLAAESLAVDATNPFAARRLAVAAWRVFPTDQAGAAVASLLLEQQQEGILPGDPANLGVGAVAFSPDGKLLAAAQANGYVSVCG